jgi:hypothetical protein
MYENGIGIIEADTSADIQIHFQLALSQKATHVSKANTRQS